MRKYTALRFSHRSSESPNKGTSSVLAAPFSLAVPTYFDEKPVTKTREAGNEVQSD